MRRIRSRGGGVEREKGGGRGKRGGLLDLIGHLQRFY